MSESEEFQPQPPRERPQPPPRRLPQRRQDEDDDDRLYRQGGGDDSIATIIPYRNPLALAAYYCGVFGLIPVVGLLLGPAALILGILGMRYVSRNPTARGTGHAIAGIVLGVIDMYNWVLIFLFLGGLLARR